MRTAYQRIIGVMAPSDTIRIYVDVFRVRKGQCEHRINAGQLPDFGTQTRGELTRHIYNRFIELIDGRSRDCVDPKPSCPRGICNKFSVFGSSTTRDGRREPHARRTWGQPRKGKSRPPLRRGLKEEGRCIVDLGGRSSRARHSRRGRITALEVEVMDLSQIETKLIRHRVRRGRRKRRVSINAGHPRCLRRSTLFPFEKREHAICPRCQGSRQLRGHEQEIASHFRRCLGHGLVCTTSRSPPH